MNGSEEDRDANYNSAYNPFPEPQTTPSGWDLSGLISAPPTDSDMNEDDSAES